MGLLWPPSWFFAAAAFVSLALWFPNRLTAGELLANRAPSASGRRRWWRPRAARLRPLGAIEAGLTIASSTWLILNPASSGATWYRVVGGLVALAILGWFLGQRQRGSRFPEPPEPGGVPASRSGARLLLIFAGFIALAAMATSPLPIAFWLGLVLALVRSRQIAVAAPRAIWIVPVGLAVAVVVGRQPIWYALPWLGAALFDGLRFLRLNFASASQPERRRVFWAYTGLLASASTAILFALAVTLGRILGCGGPGPGAFCRIVAFQDWMLLLPLPTLAVFLAVAVFYSGAVDSALVLRRTTVFSGVVILLVFVFGIVEHFLSQAFATRLPDGAATVFAAGTLALAMHPVKTLCERGVVGVLRVMIGDAESPGA